MLTDTNTSESPTKYSFIHFIYKHFINAYKNRKQKISRTSLSISILQQFCENKCNGYSKRFLRFSYTNQMFWSSNDITWQA